MNKEWFIWLNFKQEGPFSYEELRANHDITPDTLAWKEGLENWTPIREIPELKNLFKDDDSGEGSEELEVETTLPQDEIALELNNNEPPLLLWVMITLAILLYVFYNLSR